MKTILSLCDFTGEWPRPYRDAGYEVIQIDLQLGSDVLDLAQHLDELPPIHGVLAAPPCDHFTSSGARWWYEKDTDGRTAQMLAVLDACLDIIDYIRPVWWALENPVGRLPKLRPERLGQFNFAFDPCDYGDPYTKRTCLWGLFVPPLPLFIGGNWSVEPTEGSKMHLLPPSPHRKVLRSTTPSGFARAFFAANP